MQAEETAVFGDKNRTHYGKSVSHTHTQKRHAAEKNVVHGTVITCFLIIYYIFHRYLRDRHRAG